MKIFVLGLLFLTLLSGVPVAGSAQVQDTLPERPFVRGGVYDRPYLTTLLGRTAIGGYAEMHARWERVDGLTEERGFELKRWNLFTATEVSDFIRISAEIEFEDGGQEIKVEFAAIDFRIAPSFTVRGGMLLSPIGRFNLAYRTLTKLLASNWFALPTNYRQSGYPGPPSWAAEKMPYTRLDR